MVNILDVYKKYQEVSGLTVSLEKTAILGINTDPIFLQEAARVTGIQVVTSSRYLGIQIHPTYAESKRASYASVCEGLIAKMNRIYSSKVDLFHRRQLIRTVVIPSYNHVYMTFGHCEEAGDRICLLYTSDAADE